MENLKKFSGIFPAMITPFDGHSCLDVKAIEKLVNHFYDNQVHGIFVGGNMGEWYTQSLEERKFVAEWTLKTSEGRGKLIFHVGSNTLEDTIRLAKFGEQLGVDAIACLPPYCSRLTETDTVSYFNKLASVTNLPLFIYYHPILTGYQIGNASLDMIESQPNIAGLKFTDYDLLTLSNMLEIRNKSLSIMNGHDQVLFSSLKIGACGGIGSFYNVIPKAFVAVFNFMKDGNTAEAGKLQQQINQFIQQIKKFPLIPSFKYILQLNQIASENFRVSLVALSQSDKIQLERVLTESSFYQEWKITA
jgi:N-acetylneuraminate lyase